MHLDSDTYLREVLPGVLTGGLPPNRQLVVQFVVADGSDLFYRLARGAHEVCVGFADRRDVTLAFRSRSDAISFARSQLSLDDALRTNRLKIHGNEEVLPWLAERLRW